MEGQPQPYTLEGGAGVVAASSSTSNDVGQSKWPFPATGNSISTDRAVDTSRRSNIHQSGQRQQQQQNQPHRRKEEADNDNDATVEEYELALRHALKHCDKQVLNVKHWAFQGSTALCCWIHDDEEDETDSKGLVSEEKTSVTVAGQGTDSRSRRRKNERKRTLVVANIGDSRAVLSRNQIAYDVTRDHKPNDPIERRHVYDNGGQVLWHGDVDNVTNEPIEGTGLYRVNGNLALSRVIGDRYERPAVISDPDVYRIPLQRRRRNGGGNGGDDFLVLATDGLWDVMTSADVVGYIHALIEVYDSLYNNDGQKTSASSGNYESAQTPKSGSTNDSNGSDYNRNRNDAIVAMLVEEALRRGSYDNITVVIVWLSNGNDNENDDDDYHDHGSVGTTGTGS